MCLHTVSSVSLICEHYMCLHTVSSVDTVCSQHAGERMRLDVVQFQDMWNVGQETIAGLLVNRCG